MSPFDIAIIAPLLVGVFLLLVEDKLNNRK
ncbi:hypothetical protein FAM8407_02895 [Lacticaseibacillus paracasei]|jgi:hypothetical protein|nr:hypothetical protein FAM18108_00707 [Lacticaseibacillus paracasei]RND51705.1 hypothetical protein FAM18121_02914 [Lacticaseibacillus paracasei]RND51714.1 hypothetical protein FAM18121_02923 [Lacticaseibacillus paracasei]RND61611.1 hypothetical protein FAM18123_01546 [Lacticaseibacillus paracasei]RND88319.1 hypothetical protein FAM19317_02972 [Lacticaseibacillus paracasei]